MTARAPTTGTTQSDDFPLTPGAFQPDFGFPWDAFVSKLNADGSDLLYSTYLGGSSVDGGNLGGNRTGQGIHVQGAERPAEVQLAFEQVRQALRNHREVSHSLLVRTYFE